MLLAVACEGSDPGQRVDDVSEPDAGEHADAALALGLPWSAEALGPAPEPEENPSTEDKRLLGRALFYDPLLSSDRATACVTCHSEIWGLGDQLVRSVGVDGVGAIGPGRVGPNLTRRNSQPLWNLGYRSQFFWDGRAVSLEEQVRFPFEASEELNRPLSEVVADLAAIPAYVSWFSQAFPGAEPALSEQTLMQALAVFVRAYESKNAPYDRYLAGDSAALSARDLRGAALFAELECHTCHVPPRFESDRYADRRVPEREGVVDLGRFEVTGKAADRGAFRVPSLRNARETGPFFHNGTLRTFSEAIEHEVQVQVESGLRGPLDAEELTDLSEFLRRSLADVSRAQHPPKSVPSGLPIPRDGDRLLRGAHED